MESEQIRSTFLAFFEKRGHAIVPSASLVPENDPSVLFNTAGMQPFVPNLLGAAHPKGNRIANVQKCVRTGDIDEVGDKTHLTFFEMLGNWSFGDYFKEEAITWSYELLTSQDEGFGLDPSRLYVTCFAGDENAPKDTESAQIWMSLGIPEHRIYYKTAEDNWWSPGDNGPCGPSSEMFYDISNGQLGDLSPEEFEAADDRQDVVEIWNDVFMEYEKKGGQVIGKLSQRNVDTGAGLERITSVLQQVRDPYETDLFMPLMDAMPGEDVRARKVIADHIRAATFLIGDGVTPSNTDQGYVLRRLIRRAVRFTNTLEKPDGALVRVAKAAIEKYGTRYTELSAKAEHICMKIEQEEKRFRETIAKGMKRFEELAKADISGHDAFVLFSTYGFPLEMTQELAAERGIAVDEAGFQKEMQKHQEESRAGAQQKFKGGLADHSPKVTMLHTTTHLMLAGLRKYVGEHVHQAGSNITEERTRFDFTHPEKVPREVLDQVEAYVNEAIEKKCDVTIEQVPKEEAKARGVEGSFWEKYPDIVNVYTVTAPDGTIYSQELCGGPHVQNTGDIEGVFRITKEEASSSGVRRVKAVLE